MNIIAQHRIPATAVALSIFLIRLLATERVSGRYVIINAILFTGIKSGRLAAMPAILCALFERTRERHIETGST